MALNVKCLGFTLISALHLLRGTFGYPVDLRDRYYRGSTQSFENFLMNNNPLKLNLRQFSAGTVAVATPELASSSTSTSTQSTTCSATTISQGRDTIITCHVESVEACTSQRLLYNDCRTGCFFAPPGTGYWLNEGTSFLPRLQWAVTPHSNSGVGNASKRIDGQNGLFSETLPASTASTSLRYAEFSTSARWVHMDPDGIVKIGDQPGPLNVGIIDHFKQDHAYVQPHGSGQSHYVYHMIRDMAEQPFILGVPVDYHSSTDGPTRSLSSGPLEVTSSGKSQGVATALFKLVSCTLRSDRSDMFSIACTTVQNPTRAPTVKLQISSFEKVRSMTGSFRESFRESIRKRFKQNNTPPAASGTGGAQSSPAMERTGGAQSSPAKKQTVVVLPETGTFICPKSLTSRGGSAGGCSKKP